MNHLKLLPAVDALLSHPGLKSALLLYRRDIVKERCRIILAEYRRDLSKGLFNTISTKEDAIHLVIEKVIARLQEDLGASLKPVINATGIVLHTGLGRAPLSLAAQDNLQRIMSGYSNVELDTATGKRGERTDHVRTLLVELTGAEDALLVNNNAAAVFLSLNTLAFGREAIISRGQLVEIGGSFRIPEVMEKSGVIMREVGTTNRTKLSDYANAMTENTAAIVVAHTSNYRIMGFTEEVELKQVCDLAHEHNIPVIHDLGAGVIVNFRELGLPYEPLVQDSISAGADVITFSGDKVLGGPQAGLIVGAKKWLTKIHKNPIMRVVRCDKLIYAAMEATLQLYFQNNLLQEHAVLRILSESPEEAKKRAEHILAEINPSVVEQYKISIEPSDAQFGSGALPLEKLASYAIVLEASDTSIEELAARFRLSEQTIIGYVRDGKLWLDLKAVPEENIDKMIKAFNTIL
ncbi:L-seryl-tRNA(Sec) selenium transferase [candidate division KSB1 bacterium]|nr:L-seryl-tRNA(Sec) selenium transferase [candidate division KSB1 bacterium]